MNKFESKYFNTAVKMDLALLSLLKKKQFEYITVSEICKTAGVNRSTFYLHYETVADLLLETVRYLTNKFLSYFLDNKNDVSFNPYDCELGELNFVSNKYLTPYLTYIKENKEVYATAVYNVKALGFEKIYMQLYENILNPILERFRYPKEDRKYVMLYYLNGINAITNEWLKDGCAREISDISQIIQQCIFGMNGSYQDFTCKGLK